MPGPVVPTKTQPQVVTKKNALTYRAAGRTDKSRILIDLVELVKLRGGITTMRQRRYGPHLHVRPWEVPANSTVRDHLSRVPK